MRVVVILGAGASAPFGVPTLSGVFKDTAVLGYLRAHPDFQQQLEETFWDPRGVTLDTSDEGLTIEEMLTVVRDYERQTFTDAPSPIKSVETFKRHLYALSKHAVFDGRSSRAGHLNQLLEWARESWDEVTWASFNWDCLFEASYYYSGSRTNPRLAIDLEGWTAPAEGHEFLKLHGGVNWWFHRGSALYLPWGGPTLNEHWLRYEMGYDNVGVPILLEPSYYKYEDELFVTLEPQWRVFVERLMEADVVVVIGYSLPEADPRARQALTLGFQGNRDATYVVIDPAPSTMDKYMRILGAARIWRIPYSLEEVANVLGSPEFWDNMRPGREWGFL